jgi:histone acetyltransferase (RNA polymerase elongator complex component)
MDYPYPKDRRVDQMAPAIIPIFLPNVGCRDRCLFCNLKVAAEGPPSPSSVRDFIERSLSGFRSNKKKGERQVAFYGGSFTAMDPEDQVSYLQEVQPFLASGLVSSIRISTRPDALDEGGLALIREFGVKTVEIGAQSMMDQVLLLANRRHLAEDTVSAVSRLRRQGFEIGVHLMIGLPGDTLECFLESLSRVIELRPDFVRVHPALVLKSSGLELLWRTEKYSPLSLDEAVQWLKKGLQKLEAASIPVARIGLQPTKELERDLLAGPYHPALRHLVESAILFDRAKHLLQTAPKESQVTFLCHPKDVSNLRGQRNENIEKLKKEYQLNEILIQSKEEMPRCSLLLQSSSSVFGS